MRTILGSFGFIFGWIIGRGFASSFWLALWIYGWNLAEGFWSALFALTPVWAYYLVVESFFKKVAL